MIPRERLSMHYDTRLIQSSRPFPEHCYNRTTRPMVKFDFVGDFRVRIAIIVVGGCDLISGRKGEILTL